MRKVDTKEFELPETLFVRDIENRVFQGIVLQCLSRIDGIALIEGNFIDNILERHLEGAVKGITIEQDNKSHSVGIKIEINICYGYCLPEKAEEIQSLCAEEITRMTGLHVSYIHVVFKNVVLADQLKKMLSKENAPPVILGSNIEEEYNDEF